MKWILFIFLFASPFLLSQKTNVSGVVVEDDTGEPVPFAKVFFQDSKIGTETDLNGRYSIDTYYSTDTLIVRAGSFDEEKASIVRDHAQVINFRLKPKTQTLDEVVIKAPDEKPSTILYNRIVRNKPINNKKKLGAYKYETYNKIQLDLNNIGDKFQDRKVVKSLDVVMDYMDTANGGRYLPLILTESLSDYYFRTNPTLQKEVIKASRITGVENLEVNQFLGEMYQDINVYDNNIGLFDKSFMSPISDFAMGFYTFYLEDSAFIGNQWCFKMKFVPKRKGNLAFEGKMWIHDTTYAVKKWHASVSESANINYVNGFYIEQEFEQVEDEVWMLKLDKLIVDLKVRKNSKFMGFIGHKLTSRKNFIINTPHSPSFYRTSDNVMVLDSAADRSKEHWRENRHFPLNKQEEDIDKMIDSLNHVPVFKAIKNLTFLATTGYYPLGKIELGNVYSLFSYNRIEGFRNQLKLRTSNDFSERLELSGKLAYGYTDQLFKYGGGVRFNVTPKKRGMLKVYYDYDMRQLGLGENAADIDASFGSLFRTKPLERLTMIEKFGAEFKKDVGKDLMITVGGEWKELEAKGKTKFYEPILPTSYRSLNKISTFETSIAIRYAKNEEFISGSFDRISMGSKYPIITLKGVLGIKGVLGSNYEYQKLELKLEHSPRLGVLGKLNYSIFGGSIFGQAAYPFLKVHEGSQTYWYQSNSHNRLDYFEFISDQYVGASIEQHFNGLFFDRVPLIRKLKWRLVAAGKSVWGTISDRQKETMLLPDVTRSFGNMPYVESSIGIENIFKVFRVDLVWRMTHLKSINPDNPDISPLGIRAKFAIRF